MKGAHEDEEMNDEMQTYSKNKFTNNYDTFDLDDDGIYDEEYYDTDEDAELYDGDHSSSCLILDPNYSKQERIFYDKNNVDNNNNNNNSDTNTKSSNLRVLTPTKVELLSKLLENEEKSKVEEDLNSTSDNQNIQQSESSGSLLYGFFRNISNKLSFNRATYLKDENIDSKPVTKSPPRKSINIHIHDLADPDTPPSSPINLPSDPIQCSISSFSSSNSHFAQNLIRNLSSYLKITPGTPPGTPVNELDEEYINSLRNNGSDRSNSPNSSLTSEESQMKINENSKNSVLDNMQTFFDQIVNRLSLFNFKTTTTTASNSTFATSNTLNTIENHRIEIKIDDEEDEEDREMCEIENNRVIFANERRSLLNVEKCSTPPPSPSKFSPPLPDHDYNLIESYTEEEMRKSAFVKVATLNPYLKNSLDLASLLGSLSSLKRNQERVEN